MSRKSPFQSRASERREKQVPVWLGLRRAGDQALGPQCRAWPGRKTHLGLSLPARHCPEIVRQSPGVQKTPGRSKSLHVRCTLDC